MKRKTRSTAIVAVVMSLMLVVGAVITYADPAPLLRVDDSIPSDATNNGATLVNDSAIGSKALEFQEANNDTVELNQTLPGTGSFTATAHIKINDTSTQQRVFGVQPSGSQTYGFGLLTTTSGALEAFGDDGSGTLVTVNGGSVPTDSYAHVAVRWNDSAGELTLFVDGSSVATGTPAGLARSTNNINLSTADSSKGMEGLIDDWRLYDAALTQTEIQAISNGEEVATVESSSIPSEVVVNESNTYSVTVDDDDTNHTVRWDFDGDGNFTEKSGKSVSYTYNTVNSQTATVQIEDEDGSIREKSYGVSVVNDAPSVDNLNVPAEIEKNQTVNFSASASDYTINDSNITYTWDITGLDNNTTTLSGSDVSYDVANNTGEITVNLTVSDGSKSNTVSKTVQVVENKGGNIIIFLQNNKTYLFLSGALVFLGLALIYRDD